MFTRLRIEGCSVPLQVDTMIVQAIGLLDDLDKELNTYAMRVREWYGWHFPEMTRVVTDNLQYAKTVCCCIEAKLRRCLYCRLSSSMHCLNVSFCHQDQVSRNIFYCRLIVLRPAVPWSRGCHIDGWQQCRGIDGSRTLLCRCS